LMAQTRKFNHLEVGIQLASAHFGEKYRTYNNRFQFVNAVSVRYYSGLNNFRGKLMFNRNIRCYPFGADRMICGTHKGFLAGLGYQRIIINRLGLLTFVDINYRQLGGKAFTTVDNWPMPELITTRSRALEFQPGAGFEIRVNARYRIVAEAGLSLLFVHTESSGPTAAESAVVFDQHQELTGSGFIRFLFFVDLSSFRDCR
ncbi:MAG: hypothetical protein ACRC3B_00850, partial [Bacteroidia bacterium]